MPGYIKYREQITHKTHIYIKYTISSSQSHATHTHTQELHVCVQGRVLRFENAAGKGCERGKTAGKRFSRP